MRGRPHARVFWTFAASRTRLLYYFETAALHDTGAGAGAMPFGTLLPVSTLLLVLHLVEVGVVAGDGSPAFLQRFGTSTARAA